MASLQDSDPRHVAAYRLVERLAVGGMGIVYLGESPGGRLVAVKLIRPDLAGDPEFRARFRREVEAARLVSGFHTAAVVDADPDADPPWMVTQYVPGPSLDGRVRRDGPLGPAAVHQLAAALAEGLHVRAKDVCIKPAEVETFSLDGTREKQARWLYAVVPHGIRGRTVPGGATQYSRPPALSSRWSRPTATTRPSRITTQRPG
jgi:hypothetical protein